MVICYFFCMHSTPTINSTNIAGSSGSDTNPGSESMPFKTITRARDVIRQMKTAGAYSYIL